jgi:hypothetical protein
MKNEIQTCLGRPKRYNNIDGSCDMMFGLLVLGFTLLGYLQTVLPEESVWQRGLSGMLLFFAVLGPMMGLIYWIPKVIKKRITWPRTGYVLLHTDGPLPSGPARKSWWALMGAVAIIAAVIAAGVGLLTRLAGGHDWISLLWSCNVLIFVAGYAYWTYFLERGRLWRWGVLLFMVLGVLATALISPVNFVGLRWFMLLFVGLVWLGSGVASLCLYIRHNPLPTAEAE